MIVIAATEKNPKILAAAMIKEPRGYHKGALLAGAKPFGLELRSVLIQARQRVRDKLYDLAAARS